jgi:membrane fusion protein (multidrug efflux system)
MMNGSAPLSPNDTTSLQASTTMRPLGRLGLAVLAAGRVVLATAAASTLTGCKDRTQSAAPPPPPEVTFVSVTPKTVPVNYEFLGQTEASNTVEIRARVQGFLVKRHFKEGAIVDEGSELFTIDKRGFVADLEIARARLAQAKLRLTQAEKEIKRYSDLVAQRAASQKELDDWTTQADLARADILLTEAQVAKSALDLSYTSVISPIRGHVARANKDEGSLVDSGANSLLTVVQQTDPIYVTFPIGERDWLHWEQQRDAGLIKLPKGGELDDASRREQIRVALTLLDGRTFEAQGVIDFVDTQLNNRTGTGIVRATFPNANDTLRPGQFVKARLLGWERPNVLTVPQRAVLNTPGGAIVFTINKDNQVEVRPVTASQWDGTDWMIDKGLAAGDRVIVDGFLKAQPGMTVVPKELGASPSIPPANPTSTPTPSPAATPSK